jgi:hypothetical protein
MHVTGMNLKTGLVAAAVALLLLLGAGVAYAAGSGDNSSSQATGPGVEKAKSAALDETNGGRVTGTEVEDEEGYYEIEVTKDDSSQVDVHLDKDFKVLSTPVDDESSDDKAEPNDDKNEPNDDKNEPNDDKDEPNDD